MIKIINEDVKLSTPIPYDEDKNQSLKSTIEVSIDGVPYVYTLNSDCPYTASDLASKVDRLRKGKESHGDALNLLKRYAVGVKIERDNDEH